MRSILAARARALGLLALAGLILAGGLTAGKPAEAFAGTIQISPAAQTVPGSFTVTIQTNVDVAIRGAETDFTFDQTRLQVTGAVRGSVWNGATFLMGVAPQTHQEAIAESNGSGRLKNIGLFFNPDSGSVATGTHTLVTISLRAIQCGNTSLGVSAGEILDTNSNLVPVSYTGGSANPSLDTDGDGQCDGIDPDDDNDTWSDSAEVTIGADPLDRCADNPADSANPADFNNDTFFDISDIGEVAGSFGSSVPPAPARKDIAPATPDGVVDITDKAAVAGLFGQGCA